MEAPESATTTNKHTKDVNNALKSGISSLTISLLPEMLHLTRYPSGLSRKQKGI